jgi:phosphate-selective porin OprO/OprP
VGHQKVPFGQQSMTSSNYQVFQERALPDAFIDTSEEGRRRMGVVLSSYGDHWSAAGGFFGAGVNGGAGTRNSDWGSAGRAVWAPMAEKTKVLTFGSSINYRKFESQSELDYASRPEAHLAGVKMVNTGALPDAKNTLEWNLETSMVWGRFHAQAEYTGSEVTQKNDMKNLSLGGWYVQSGVFLTGESRNYDVKSGQYKAITPLNSYGAWELAARYSSIDLDNNGVKGGKENDVTVALNWWVNTNILMRFNYVYADVSPNSAETLTGHDETAHAFTGRAQIVF